MRSIYCVYCVSVSGYPIQAMHCSSFAPLLAFQSRTTPKMKHLLGITTFDILNIDQPSECVLCVRVYALAPLSLSHPSYSVYAQQSIQQSLPINSLFMVF